MPERTEKPVENEMPMPDPDFGSDPLPPDAQRERAAHERRMAEARAERLELARARRRRKVIAVTSGLGEVALALILWKAYGLVGLFIGLEPISVYALIHLWRRRDGKVWKRILWTPVILVPLFGPIVYGGLYDPPPPTGRGGGEDVGVIAPSGGNLP